MYYFLFSEVFKTICQKILNHYKLSEALELFNIRKLNPINDNLEIHSKNPEGVD